MSHHLPAHFQLSSMHYTVVHIQHIITAGVDNLACFIFFISIEFLSYSLNMTWDNYLTLIVTDSPAPGPEYSQSVDALLFTSLSGDDDG